jgi:hypothetical protein
MKIPIQLFDVRGTVYPFDITFSIGQSDKTLAKFLSKYDDIDIEYEMTCLKLSGAGCTSLLNNNHVVVRLVPEYDFVDFQSNVAHEIFHAVTTMMENIGLKLEIMVSDEAYAYMIGHITREFYKQLKTEK